MVAGTSIQDGNLELVKDVVTFDHHSLNSDGEAIVTFKPSRSTSAADSNKVFTGTGSTI